MLKLCILVLATASYVSSAGVSDANTFVDTIFREKMPFLVKGSPRLFPYATIADFKFKVYKNQITNRDLKVNMTRGEIRGLDTALQRLGDCQAPFLRDGQTVVVCNLAVQGLNITFTSLAKGDTLVAIWKTIWVNVGLDVTYDSNLSLNEGRREKFKEEIVVRVKDELRHIFYNDYKDLLRRAVESVTFPRI
ncbi:hypothetical protein MTO96_019456 [Rhipicephalus appendiculatus]